MENVFFEGMCMNILNMDVREIGKSPRCLMRCFILMETISVVLVDIRGFSFSLAIAKGEIYF